MSTVRDPVLWVTAPARQLTTGEDYSRIDTNEIDRAVAGLVKQGWRVKESENLRQMTQRFAGTDAERAAGINAAFADPECDVILAMRGGYGTGRILPLIDWDRAGESYAAFVGLSDLTALNLALYAKTGRPSWQGPVAHLFENENSVRDAAFQSALSQSDFEFSMPSNAASLAVEGTLWGGNLTVLVSLIGTPWFPEIENGILFIEDVAEPAWRVERLLWQLMHSGVLSHQKAILTGDFTGANKTAGEGAGRFALSDAFRWIQEATGVPFVTGLPFGHRPDTMMLPVGVASQVTVNAGRLTVYAEGCAAPASVPWREAPPADLWWH